MTPTPRFAPRLLLTVVLAAALAGGVACASQRSPAPRLPKGAAGVLAPRFEDFPPESRAFVDTLQHRTFQWFWDTADPVTGLTPDRWPTKSFASVAAMGFGLASYPVGVEHGWVTREAAAKRTFETLRFLWLAPQDSASTHSIGYRGFYYHFLNPSDGTRFEKLELSFIDTGLLVAGALFCAEYFDRGTPEEAGIRAYADSIYRRIDWAWMQPRAPLMSLGWTPEEGHLPYDTAHYNETTVMLLLAMGSPTHPAHPDTWRRYTQGYRWGRFHGQDHLGFAPLFGHQSSHLFVDYRGIRDAYMREKGCDYYENSRRATYAQRQYAIDNPGRWDAYGPLEWGLSACDGGPYGTFVVDGRSIKFEGYWARGASHTEVLDDGTLTPNAAGGSIMFAPEIVVPTLMHMANRHGERLYARYGFLDAYNPTFRVAGREADGIDPVHGWYDRDYLGIDQGLIVLAIENWRSGLLWERMKKNPYLLRGLERAGFTGGWLGTPDPPR
ncbi:MAG: glucoamylase family protein [Candidatus Eisenbacteria bacterium]